MGNGPRQPNESGRGSDLRRAAEYLLVELCDCLWELTPAWLALQWLRWRLARLRKREAALRAAAKDDRGTTRWPELDAAYAALECRRASLDRSSRPWLERTVRMLMIVQLLLGLWSVYWGWLSAIDAVRQAFRLAVAVEP